MNKYHDSFATHLIGLAMAATITLALLAGVVQIAGHEDAGNLPAASALAQSKSAPAPRS